MLLLGVWGVLTGLLSIHALFMPVLFFFVPGAILIYYWKGRGLFLQDSPNWIFPMLLAVVVSLLTMGAGVVPLQYLDKGANAWIIWGFAVFPIVSAIVLTELLMPQTLSPRCAIKPAPAWILSGVLGWASGFGDWLVFWGHSPWITGLGTVAVIAASVFVYRDKVKPHPDMAAFLAHFFAWMGLLVVVMLYASAFFHI